MFASSSSRSRAAAAAAPAPVPAAAATTAPPTVALGTQLPLARLAGDNGDALASVSTSCLVSIEPAERAETVEDDGRLLPPPPPPPTPAVDDGHSPDADPDNDDGHSPDVVDPAPPSAAEPAPA